MIKRPNLPQGLLEAHRQQLKEFEKQTVQERIEWMKKQTPEPIGNWNVEVFDSKGRYKGFGF